MAFQPNEHRKTGPYFGLTDKLYDYDQSFTIFVAILQLILL